MGTAAKTLSDFESMRKIMSVRMLLVHTESSVIASQSGPPFTPFASIVYCASGIKLDIGACTPGTPGFCVILVSCANDEAASVTAASQLRDDFMAHLTSGIGQAE